jgi:hypothetical protein
MGLEATVVSAGRAANLVEATEPVEVRFTAPPADATDVRVEIWEAKGPGDAQAADQLVATFRGAIRSGKFELEQPNADPLAPPPPPNPEPNPKLRFSSNPPALRVGFPGIAPVPVRLPDVENENFVYEIKLKARGVAASKPLAFDGTAILQVRIGVDVMIVPDVKPGGGPAGSELAILEENARFGEQWQAHAPARRALVKVAVDGTLAAFRTAALDAAAKAHGGSLILFTGHGAATGVRGAKLTAFDTVPSSVHGFSSHPFTIDSDVLNLPAIARKVNGKWTVNPPSTDQAQVDRLAPRHDLLVDLGAALKAAGAARFLVLSCNMGRDMSFRVKLATIMNSRVAGYDRLVATNTIVNAGTSKVLTFLVDDESNPLGSQPPFKDFAQAPFHEVPSGFRESAPPVP